MKRNRISDRTFIEAAGGKPCPVLDGKSLLPVFAKALVLVGQNLFLAGPDESEDAKSSSLDVENPEEIEASYLGKLGASLCVVSAKNGTQLAEYKLESPPVFDGMIAAQKKIFMALEDGSLVCYRR
jgi:hypothetical protein